MYCNSFLHVKFSAKILILNFDMRLETNNNPSAEDGNLLFKASSATKGLLVNKDPKTSLGYSSGSLDKSPTPYTFTLSFTYFKKITKKKFREY